MEKSRKKQFAIILFVAVLTLYNILPTIFYYANPLHQPVDEKSALTVAQTITERVDSLEEDSLDWVSSLCDLLHLRPLSIQPKPNQPQLISVRFQQVKDAETFCSALPKASALIPFSPLRLEMLSSTEDLKEVLLYRQIPLRLKDVPLPELFSFGAKGSAAYNHWVYDRAAKLIQVLQETRERHELLEIAQKKGEISPIHLLQVAKWIERNTRALKKSSKALTRLYASVFSKAPQKETLSFLVEQFEKSRDLLAREKIHTENPIALSEIEDKSQSLLIAQSFFKNVPSEMIEGTSSHLCYEKILDELSKSPFVVELGDRHPLFREIQIDWDLSKLHMRLHADIESALRQEHKESLEQLLMDELARLNEESGESLFAEKEGFSTPLHSSNASHFLFLKTDALTKAYAQTVREILSSLWSPAHPDLLPEQFPIVDLGSYRALSPIQQKLCLVVFSPEPKDLSEFPHLKLGSVYIWAKGLDLLFQQEQSLGSKENSLFSSDIQALFKFLKQFRFQNAGPLLFEQSQSFSPLLSGSRESFLKMGSKQFLALELSTHEQLLLTQNRIDTQIHEDLVKWRDEYASAQVNPYPKSFLPKPTKSVFWSNLSLSLRKYFRGDERKIIRWGLDLSGGKSVQIELRDANHSVVTNELDLKQGMNELYQRVNKMGLSEVSIRQLGTQIAIDFPGSGVLSASELIQPSSLFFHVVNEGFSPLDEEANRFLQQVWNEALVKHRTTPEEIHAIAYTHLYGGELLKEETALPKTESARILFERGLRMSSPRQSIRSSTLNDSLSKIARLRGGEPKDWQGASHPLLFVFSHHALEGAHLENIHSGYDTANGNYLSFEVKKQSSDSDSLSARDTLSNWTKEFCKETVVGTFREVHPGRGWRMAAILNDTIISLPTLNSPLKDSAMISGSFSQREATILASDLKAGSLTFTPHILSEKQVSPELGLSDRVRGIGAALCALFFVVTAMVSYYRFAGVVASIAVLFNLLMMWGMLQNLQATLSLAGIAGIILTVGMAVDANVLVFERIKEELAQKKLLAVAIQSGYRKAFRAILDSNVTTIITALILLNFDAGPIKGFAITLIIGIASSMFSALFATRAYFLGWVKKSKNRSLNMANWFGNPSFDFLKQKSIALFISFAIVLGAFSLYIYERPALMGMDFTGGFSLCLAVEPSGNECDSVKAALIEGGLSPQDFEVRSMSCDNDLRILLSSSLEHPGKLFHSLETSKLDWVLQTLQKQGIQPISSETTSPNWTAMSGQMSDAMKNHALLGLLLSFGCIFIYLAIRFETAYSLSAVICLFYDVCITLSCLTILRCLGLPLQIDLNAIAALMTIIGYSLNDKIIVFDRIREEKTVNGMQPAQFANCALNATFSRTTITSGTTLLALIALVLFGGGSIFNFSMIMTIGVLVGTLSSWFIATPLLLLLQRSPSSFEMVKTTLD